MHTFEAAAPNISSNRMCTVLTMCTNSEFESQPATPTSNRHCALIRVCNLNAQIVWHEPTATSDRICLDFTSNNVTVPALLTIDGGFTSGPLFVSGGNTHQRAALFAGVPPGTLVNLTASVCSFWSVRQVEIARRSALLIFCRLVDTH